MMLNNINHKKYFHKKYMRNIYSKYWITARDKKYINLPYDGNLIKLIESLNIKGAYLDIAIGTGNPFGKNFYKKTNEFKGIDISPLLVEECKKLNPGINVEVGDAENLVFQDEKFSLTYCFHSSWYFSNLQKSISEMIRVTKSDGYIIFDIMNITNAEIKEKYKKLIKRERSRIYPFIHILKKIIKLVIGFPESWRYINIITPSNPFNLIQLFNQFTYNIYGRSLDETLKLLENENDFEKYSRLVFLIKKSVLLK